MKKSLTHNNPMEVEMSMLRRCFLAVCTVAILAGGMLFGLSPAQAQQKVAIVLPGSITDQAFNQALYEGVQLIEKELGLEIAYSEKVKQADQAEHLEDYARRGFGLVLGAGGEFVESTKRAAKRYPDTLFACLNCALIDNVATVNFDNVSVGYLLGFTAGKMSTTGKIGLISGQDILAARKIVEGLEKGLKAATGGGEVLVTFTNDWDDVAKAKEAAFGQISQGADAIVPYLDNGIVGVMQGLKEKGKWGLGVLSDMGSSWPDTNLISVNTSWAKSILFLAQAYVDGTAERKDYLFGIGSVALNPGTMNSIIPAATISEIDMLVDDLRSGKLKP